MEKYQIELTEKQLIVVQEALEFYTRFLLGQIDRIPMSLDFRLKDECRPNYCNPVLDQAFSVIKKEMFGLSNSGASYRIGTKTFPTLEEDKELTESQISYEIYKMVLYNWRRESIQKSIDKEVDPGWTVHDTLPPHLSGEPLIKITKINDEEVL